MSVLLGGLITLAVTALVQIAIIPWVQTRTRRRDRWEKDVIELETLLRWDIPHLLTKAKIRGEQVRSLAMPDETSRDFEAAEESGRQLLEQVRRLRILENRVRLERRKADYWRQLSSRVGDATTDVIEASVLFTQPESLLREERWQAAWSDAKEGLSLAADTLSQVSIPMVPPPTNGVQQRLFDRRTGQLHDYKRPSRKAIRGPARQPRPPSSP